MPSYDFAVDLESLIKAAQGTAETVELFHDKDVSDLVPDQGSLGNDTVWGAVDDFQERWEMGMNNLCKDVEEIAGRLGKIAMNYAEFDKSGHESLTAVAGDLASLKILG
jgi:hypothetical protein